METNYYNEDYNPFPFLSFHSLTYLSLLPQTLSIELTIDTFFSPLSPLSLSPSLSLFLAHVVTVLLFFRSRYSCDYSFVHHKWLKLPAWSDHLPDLSKRIRSCGRFICWWEHKKNPNPNSQGVHRAGQEGSGLAIWSLLIRIYLCCPFPSVYLFYDPMSNFGLAKVECN